MSAPTTAQTPDAAWAPWLAIAALALAVRLLHLWQLHGTPVADHLMGDGRAYDAWAQEIVTGGWLGRQTFYQAPLYPYFLAAIHWVLGRDLTAVRLVQTLLGSAACVLLGLAGARFFSRRVGLGAGLLLALWPSAIFADGLIQKTVLDGVLMCALLAVLSLAVRQPRWAPWCGVGALVGALALARENALAFVPVLLAAAALQFRALPWWPRRATLLAAVLAGLALVLLPVGLRNLVVGGEFHLTTAQFGPNFYIGNHAAATGMYRPLRYGRGDARYERRDATELAEAALGRPLSPGEVSAYWTRLALDDMARDPSAWLALMARKATLFVSRSEVGDTEDQYTYGDWSWPLAVLTPILNFGLLVPLAAAGMVLAWPRRREIGVLYALLAVYAAGVIATFVMARYRHVAVPLLILFAASAASDAAALLRVRPWRRLGVAAAIAALIAVPVYWPVQSEAVIRAGTLYNIARAIQDEPGRLEESIGYYRRAVALDPSYALAFTNLGGALAQSGQLTEAVAAHRQAIALRPQEADFHYNLGTALAQAGDGEGAVAAYERALALDPRHVDATVNLGALFHGRGDVIRATQYYRAALVIDPRSVSALTNLGVLAAQQGRHADAIEAFRAALAVDPGSPIARDNLAVAEREAAAAGNR